MGALRGGDGREGAGPQSNRLSVPRALLLVNVRAAQQLVIRRRRTIRLCIGGAWERRRRAGPGESYSDVIIRVPRGLVRLVEP
jgi:hypothetical protein